MFTIKKFNNISDVIYSHLPQESFAVTDSGERYDGILVRSADLHEVAFPPELAAIARAGAGVNNIPIDACSQAGIVVFNTPGANANAVKELVVCGMLLAGRRIIPGAQWLAEQHENNVTGIEKLVEKAKNQFVGPELAGKKLGVIGLGAIGVMVANAAWKSSAMTPICRSTRRGTSRARSSTRPAATPSCRNATISRCTCRSMRRRAA